MKILGEIIALGRYLQEHCLEKGGLGSLEELDGFLFGVVTAPNLMMPSQWLDAIWGTEHVFASNELAAKHAQTLMAYYNTLIERLAGPQDLRFRLLVDGVTDNARGELSYDAKGAEESTAESVGQGWAQGFLYAVDLDEIAWDQFAEEWAVADDILVNCLDLVRTDDGTFDPDNAEAVPLPLLQPAERLAALHQVSLALPELYALNQQLAANRQTVRRAAPKVGRNDPCPCGSGRKYKQCCGAN